jgi:hypothetical protein
MGPVPQSSVKNRIQPFLSISALDGPITYHQRDQLSSKVPEIAQRMVEIAAK